MKFILEDLDFEVTAGPNTKQVWVYESINNVWIDPPKSVIDEINRKTDRNDWDEKCFLLEQIVDIEPDWLYETDYWYDADEYDI